MTNQEQRFVEDQSFRREVLDEIRGQESNQRRASSLQDTEIYDGKIRPYVLKALSDKGYTQKNIAEMPVVASVNVTRKVVDARASLYKGSPNRTFSNVTDDQADELAEIYEDMMMDSRMLSSNRMFELQSKQSHMMIIPKMGKLKARVLKAHQIDVIPSEEDSEIGEIFIISSYDKHDSKLREHFSNNKDESIADKDDYKKASERYIIFSSSLHFVMDGHGEILTEEVDNPIAPICPVFEISSEAKDFEYWRQATGGSVANDAFAGGELSNFSVEYNLDLTMLSQTVEMGSFGQAWIKGPEGSLPKSQVLLGPTRVLHLVTDPTLPNGDTEFGYSNAGADISSALQWTLSKLAQFLSSQGVPTQTVSGDANANEAFSSGIERLLALVEKHEASKESMAIYKHAETKAFEIIKAWIDVAGNSDLLPEITLRIPDDATMSIVYERPEAVLTETEKLDIIERKLEQQLMTKQQALIELYNMSKDEAKKQAEEIEREWMPSSEAISTTSNFQSQV